jgi:heme exporter protein A
MLTAERLTLVRGHHRLAPAISFELPAGQALQVQGDNGSGKTTLLRTLCGLRPAFSGAVSWQRAALPGAGAALQGELAYIGHEDALHGELTARENLDVLMRVSGEPQPARAVDRALEAAGIDPQRSLPLHSLSRGQRRRVALARLALTRRRLWVLDEPFEALDASSRTALVQRLCAHLLGGGLAVVTCHSDPCLPTESTQHLTLAPTTMAL